MMREKLKPEEVYVIRGGSSVISGLHSMKQTFDLWESFRLDNPQSRGEAIFGNYNKKLEWIARDLLTCPLFPDWVNDAMRKEWNSDAFSVPAIQEKLSLLNPMQRDMIELVIDSLLRGEKVEFVDEKK